MKGWTTDSGEGSKYFDTSIQGIVGRLQVWARANQLPEHLAEAAFLETAGPSKPFALVDEDVLPDAGTTGAPHLKGSASKGQRYRVFQEGPHNLGDWYSRYCGEHAEEPFLVCRGPGPAGRRECRTFAEALRCAGELAAYLASELGVKKGDRVAQLGRNWPEWCLSFMAATASGFVAVPMNSLWQAGELEYGINDSGVSVAFVDGERAALLLPLCREGRLPSLKALVVNRDPQGAAAPGSGGPVKVLALDEVLQAARGRRMPEVGVSPDDTALVMYTSGTTGHPKGAVSTHRAVISAVRGSTFFSECGRQLARISSAKKSGGKKAKAQECTLCPVPLFHTTGTHSIFLFSFLRGRKMVLMQKWDALEALRLIEAEKVTHFTGVPTMSMELLHHPDYAKYDISSLKNIGGGGAPPPKRLSAETGKRGKAPSQGWGLTESNALTVATFSAREYTANPSSCGRAQALADLKVVDHDNRELTPGDVGEILIRGATVMKEYLNRPEATAEAVSVDGWFRTGDIGRLDPDGALYIMDRHKDLIIRGGENVSCAEVECAIHDHPSVQECSVFSLPDERLGELVAAAIVQRPGSPGFSGPEMAAFCGERLAKFKVPTEIFLWHEGEQLPRGATGKIPKRAIREQIQDGKAPCRKILPPPAKM